MTGRVWAGSLVAAAVVAAVLPLPLSGQVRASERARVSQTVDGTVITVDYARPRARGRTELFGGQMHWGEVWTPGANEATVLELGAEVDIEGRTVPAGRWSVWMVLNEEGPWELVLDPRDTLYHTEPPGMEEDQIRMPVQSAGSDFVEVLTWSFPEVRNDGTTLVMAWGDRRVALDVAVRPTLTLTTDPAVAAPFLGAWEMTWGPGPGDGPAPPPGRLVLTHAPDGRLFATMGPLDGAAPGDADSAAPPLLLSPAAEGIFRLSVLDEEGVLMETFDGHIEFEFEDGRPVRFAMRGIDDEIMGRGRRLP